MSSSISATAPRESRRPASPTPRPPVPRWCATQWREVGLGAQILRDLGVVSIRNLATSTRSYVGLSGFGIEMMAEETLDG